MDGGQVAEVEGDGKYAFAVLLTLVKNISKQGTLASMAAGYDDLPEPARSSV